MRSNQAELKNAMHAMQAELDALTARVSEAAKIISDLEDGLMERKEIEENREKQPTTHEERLREFNGTLERTNIRIIRTKKAGWKVYLIKSWLRTSQIWGKKHAFTSKRQRGLLLKSIKIDQHHDI